MRINQEVITYQDYLAPSQAAPSPAGRDLVPINAPSVPAITQDTTSERARGREPPFGGMIPDIDIRNASPGEVSEISLDLYAAGILSWDEYAMLAFQPETQPEFNKTIGALTGEKAAPNRPRDFVAIWEERLSFEKRYNAEDPPLIKRTERIANVLRQIDTPTNLII